MKKIFLMGRSEAGKTSLTQALKGEELHIFIRFLFLISSSLSNALRIFHTLRKRLPFVQTETLLELRLLKSDLRGQQRDERGNRRTFGLP